ncbi:MAG: TetR/AcrR family transcriptional regulator [Bacteroidales bacterium]
MKTENSDTRELILEKTYLLLLLKGVDSVSISDIQKKTGISRGLLYHYFGNKEALFQAIAEKYLINLLQLPKDLLHDMTLSELIEYYIYTYADLIQKAWGQYSDQYQITIANYDFLIFRLSELNPDLKERFKVLWEDEVKVWERALVNSQIKSELRDLGEPYETAKYFQYLINGIWMNSVTQGTDRGLIVTLEQTLKGFYRLLKR